MADPKSPSAFISYSHDSDDHALRVLALADTLRAGGINVILDQYVDPAPEEGWSRWMDRYIDKADFVLMVCTEAYRRRVMGQEKPGKGPGVRWEGTLIYNRIHHDKPSGSRYIPILLSGSVTAHIPDPVRGHFFYRIAAFTLADPGYEGLYRYLTGQVRPPPPDLDMITTLPPRPRRGIDSSSSGLSSTRAGLDVASASDPETHREARRMANPPRIFVSYSHKDKSWLEEFRRHIQPLIRGGHIDPWEDSKIAPGQEWHKEITKAIEAADIAVLLVSSDFLGSEFIANEELPRLLAGRKTVFWIAIRHSNYTVTPIAKYQCANAPNSPLASLTKSNRDKAWVEISQKLLKVDSDPR